MAQFICRCTFGMAVLLALFSPAPGDENRQFFQKPETPQDYWKRIQFEIEVGKFDIAAQYLTGFIASLAKLKPDEARQFLLQLEEKEGMSAFLRLRQIPELLENKKARLAMRADVNKLIDQVTTAVRQELRDPRRLAKFIKNLSKTPQERAWAINQLRRSGAAAVPYLLRELQLTEGKLEHQKILSAMLKLGQNIIPPLLAALDIPDNNLRSDILFLVKQRGETSAASELWYPSASSKYPEAVQLKAAQTLAYLRRTRPDRLPAAKLALTQLANDYYYHRIKYADPNAVTVWKYDAKKKELEETRLTASAAEEYYGLRHARRALDLDATYRPAQVVFLSTVLDKGYGSDFHLPLAQKAPAVKQLLTTVNPDLVADVLDRALRDRRLPVILGAIQTLGDLADVRAGRLALRGGPVLVKALNYPDRRVQMAAADAMLRIPGEPPPSASLRIVQIMRRILLADPVTKVLVAYFHAERAMNVAKVVKTAGFVPVVVRNRRSALKRLKDGADIDAILIDYTFPGWEREFPYVLAALRADKDAGLLPVVVTAPEEQLLRVRRFTERYRNVWVEDEEISRDATRLKSKLREYINESAGRPLSNIERQVYATAALNWLGKMSRGEVAGYDVQPAADAIYQALRSDQVEMATAAIEMVGRLPGPKPQRELAALVLDQSRDKLRALAAIHLSRQIQQNGLLLPRVEVKRIQELFATTQDAKLKANVALVIGSMRPSPRVTGKRLQKFRPPAPKEK